jgi:hypothetical protein
MAEHIEDKTTLIVTGVARSGTTALGELLNAHPLVGLGIERFKFQFLREDNFSADLFTRERFFDFRPEDTNLIPELRPAWAPTYEAIAEKWDSARVIGDKVPDLIPVLQRFLEENPGFRYISILRNLKDVGLSWQTRADKPRDAWPAGKGFVAACESWAEQMGILHDMLRDRKMREKVLLLDYDSMYDDPEMTEAALLAFLDLPEDESFSEVLRSHAEFAMSREPRKVPKKFAEEYRAVEQGHIRGLRKVAREQAEIWSARYGVSPGAL